MKNTPSESWMQANAAFCYQFHSDPDKSYEAKAHAVSPEAIAFTPMPFREIIHGEKIYLNLPVPGTTKPLKLSARLDSSDTKITVARLTRTDTLHKSRLHPAFSQLVARRTWDTAAHLKSQSRLITRTAANADAYIRVAQLLYREYRLREYCEERADQLYFTHFALLPDSRTFIAEDSQSLLGTMSLVPDSVFGLPCEGVYPQEVSKLRRSGKKLAELSLVALNGDHANVRHSYLLADSFKMLVFIELVKLLFDCVRTQGITDVLVATHPSNEPTYHFMLFERIGAARSYKSARGNPAILLHADLTKIRQRHAIPKDISSPRMEMGLATYLFHYDVNYGLGVTQDLVWKLLQQDVNLQKNVVEYFRQIFPAGQWAEA